MDGSPELGRKTRRGRKETSRDKAGLAGGVENGEPLGSKSGETLAGENTHNKEGMEPVFSDHSMTSDEQLTWPTMCQEIK